MGRDTLSSPLPCHVQSAGHNNLGNGATAEVHNHRYDFNDEAIPYGAALYAAIVEKKLPKGTGDC